MSGDLLKSFQEAYRNLELLPLVEEKDLQQFRVDYGAETIAELEQLTEDSPNSDGKIIFSGRSVRNDRTTYPSALKLAN